MDKNRIKMTCNRSKQQIVTNQPHNQDMSFRDVRQILDEDEALPINPNIPQNVR